MKKIIFLFLIFNFSLYILKAQQWNAVGAGLNGPVYSFAVYNNELYAGGWFVTNGDGDTIGCIAKWNGSKWIKVGEGLNGLNSAVSSFTIYKNILYAGGGFKIGNDQFYKVIAKWNGTNWDSIGQQLNASISTMAFYNNELYAGGYFDSAGSLLVNYIARWNDTVWKAVGNGVSCTCNPFVTPVVVALAVYNNRLILTGIFDFWNPPYRYGIGVWDGNTLDTLFNSSFGSSALTVYHNDLYGGGGFTQAGGFQWINNANRIAHYNGVLWDTCSSGTNNDIRSLYVYNDELYAGGFFDTAGGILVNHIAKWNETEWSEVGGGTNGYISAMIEFDSSLFIGGNFTMAGTSPANNVARWGMPTGIKEINNMQLAVEVYPNPTTAQLNIRIEKNKSAVIELYDIAGKKLLQQNISSQSSINIPFLSSGIYFYKITDKEKKTARGKIVIE